MNAVKRNSNENAFFLFFDFDFDFSLHFLQLLRFLLQIFIKIFFEYDTKRIIIIEYKMTEKKNECIRSLSIKYESYNISEKIKYN